MPELRCGHEERTLRCKLKIQQIEGFRQKELRSEQILPLPSVQVAFFMARSNYSFGSSILQVL